jgi:hypothetical protein
VFGTNQRPKPLLEVRPGTACRSPGLRHSHVRSAFRSRASESYERSLMAIRANRDFRNKRREFLNGVFLGREFLGRVFFRAIFSVCATRRLYEECTK